MATFKFCNNNNNNNIIPAVDQLLLDKSFRGVNIVLPLNSKRKRRNNSVKVACIGNGNGNGSGSGSEGEKKKERRNFLSLEEAGLVEMSGLSTHERFLSRLTISSLNLLRVISEQEGCSIEELNAGRICDWFLKDKLKREQNLETAILQWDDDPLF